MPITIRRHCGSGPGEVDQFDPHDPKATQCLKTSAEGPQLPKNTNRKRFPVAAHIHTHMHFQVWIAVQGLNAGLLGADMLLATLAN